MIYNPPILAVTHDGPFEFIVPSYSVEYYNLTKIILTETIQIIKDDGSECEAANDVSRNCTIFYFLSLSVLPLEKLLSFQY